MGTILRSIFVHNPLQDLSSAVVVKVGIDIGKGDTVWIEETLEQEVVLERVETCDAEAVCNDRSGCRTSTRSYPNAQLVSCAIDEVLYDEEVTWEAHRLHDVKFEANALVKFL